jgi:hypothetical protein
MDVASQQNASRKACSMSALLGIIGAIYGLSLAIAVSGGLLLAVSPRFRKLLIGDRPSL